MVQAEALQGGDLTCQPVGTLGPEVTPSNEEATHESAFDKRPDRRRIRIAHYEVPADRVSVVGGPKNGLMVQAGFRRRQRR